MNIKRQVVTVATSIIISQSISLNIFASEKINIENKNYVLKSTQNLQRNSSVVNIPDIRLKASLNKLLGQSNNADITKEQLESFNTLYLHSSYKITNLEGLQYCTNLKTLNLYDNNQIKDLSPLSSLINLENLTWQSNKEITDISPLANLTNLKSLKIGNSENLKDISALNNLTKLEYLSIENTSVSDISSLSKLTNLKDLNLGFNKINDISSLSKLTNLNMLYLGGNEISDISSLSSLTNLKTLSLKDNKISDISPLANLNGFLEELDLSYNEISDISPLANLGSLAILHLNNNKISELPSLKGLTFLRGLKLDNNKISDISPLLDLDDIGFIGLSGNRICNPMPLIDKFKHQAHFSLVSQTILLDEIISNGSYAESVNPVNNNIYGLIVQPEMISDDGVYDRDRNVVKWDNITKDTTASYYITHERDKSYIYEAFVKQPIKYQPSSNTNPSDGDNEIPIIKASDILEIFVGEKINPMIGVTAIDSEDGDITDKVICSPDPNALDTSKVGTYILVYTVQDSDGNISKPLERKIVIKERKPPIGNENQGNIGDNPEIKPPSLNNPDYKPPVYIPPINDAPVNQGNVSNPPQTNTGTTIKLTDIKNHWAQKDIENFVNKGYINGYKDGTFRPDNKITRAEFITIMNKVFGLEEKGTQNFKDVSKNDWYYNDLLIAIKAGYVDGYEDNTFRPNQPITRQEACVMISNCKNLKDSHHEEISKLSDKNKISSWAKDSVEGMIERGYMNGNNNKFRPKDNITRSEVVSTLSRIPKGEVPSVENTPIVEEEVITEKQRIEKAAKIFMKVWNVSEQEMLNYEVISWDNMWLSGRDYYYFVKKNPEADGDTFVFIDKETFEPYTWDSTCVLIPAEEYNYENDNYGMAVLEKIQYIYKHKVEYIYQIPTYFKKVEKQGNNYKLYVDVKEEGYEDKTTDEYMFNVKNGKVVSYQKIN